MAIFKFKRYAAVAILAIVASLSANIGISAADSSPDAAVVIESVQTTLLVHELLRVHLTKHKLTPELMRQIVKETANYLDPEKLFLSKEDIASIDAISDESMAEAARRCQTGDFSQFRSLMDNFLESKIEARRAAFAGLEKTMAALKTLTPDKKPDEWASKAEMDDKLEYITLNVYKNDKSYLDDDDAMTMAIRTVRDVMKRDEERCSKPDAHLYMFLQALAAALDPHSNYMDDKSNIYKKLNEGFVGIGVQIRPSSKGVFVESVIPTGAAEASGKFSRGDIIVEVDGLSVVGMDMEESIQLIQGKENTEVTIKLLKADTKKVETVVLKRTKLNNGVTQMRAKRSHTAGGDVIIVTIGSFYTGVASDLMNKIAELNKDGKVVGMVLDLRDDGGGLLWEAVKMISIFVTDGNAVGQRDSQGVVTWIKVANVVHFDGPVVVLVNQRSASASELTASALQDYGRAVVVGHTQSYGKGTVQNVLDISKLGLKGIFAITVEQFFSPAGRSVQRDGVVPDIYVPGPKLDEDELEKHNYNAIPTATVPSTIDGTATAKKWRVLKAKVLDAVAKKSADRVEKNKAFKTAYDEGKHPAEDYQGEEAMEIVGDMFLEMGK